MRGCLFTLLLGAIVIGVVVVIGLPAIAAGVITAGLTGAGLVSADTAVTVRSDPPTDLLGLHADTVHVTATDATFRGMDIASLDLTLGNVAVLDRTAGTVDGELRGVTIRPVGGEKVTLDTIAIQGGGSQITTTTVVPNAEVEALIADAVERQAGIRPTAVTLAAPDMLTVRIAGATLGGKFAVNASGDLVVRVAGGVLAGTELVLLHAGQDLPIKLTSAKVTSAGGLRLSGNLTIGILG
jgi:hypothetical protein